MNPFKIAPITDAEPGEVPIMQAEGQPMWTCYIEQLTPEDLTKVLVGPSIGGLREGSDAEKKAKRSRIKRYVKRVFAEQGWTGCTPANVKALLKRACKKIDLGPLEDADEIPFDVDFACDLLLEARSEDFDQPILRAVKHGVQKAQEIEEGNESGSEPSA
ncbi:hypothetical protein K2Z84_05385 [Candidatus Binatia bacterium]|nr:hypothetical protein [Candidatus Binatia bacterium]